MSKWRVAIDPILLASGTQLAHRIRTRQLTSRQVVEAHIGQIRRVNPVLNAVVAERFADALAEADVADRELGGEGALEGAFKGVPCTIKECFALVGMPNTAGVVARRGVRVEADATAVQRLRGAGCVPLGVTNTSEGCMWIESNNRVYGRTNNPYDPEPAWVAARAGRAPSSRPAARPSASAPTWAARSACPRSSTGCSATSRAGAWCPAAGSGRWPRTRRAAT